MLSLRGKTLHATAFGGFLTIVTAVLLTVFIVEVIERLVRGNHYNLDEFSSGIYALDMKEVGDNQYNLTGEVAPCAVDVCDSITVREFLYLIAEIEYLVSFKGLNAHADCSGLQGNLSFIPQGAFRRITIASLQFFN